MSLCYLEKSLTGHQKILGLLFTYLWSDMVTWPLQVAKKTREHSFWYIAALKLLSKEEESKESVKC